MKLKCTVLALLTGVAALADPPPLWEREAAYHVITRWDAGVCEGDTVTRWDNMIDAWYDAITSGHGAANSWRPGGFQKNGNIVDSDFVDPDRKAWGQDFRGIHLDAVDAIMVGLHGTEYDDDGTRRWYGSVRVDEDPGGNCNADQDDIDLDGDAEFVHLSSCHSLCDDLRRSWLESCHHVHLITGFHGVMFIGSNFYDDYEDFADDGFEMAIATAWVDQLYKRDVNYECKTKVLGVCLDWAEADECPVVLAAGTDEENARDHLDTEQYDDVLSHPEDRHGWATIFVGGCDPKGDPPQPD